MFLKVEHRLVVLPLEALPLLGGRAPGKLPVLDRLGARGAEGAVRLTALRAGRRRGSAQRGE
jgi:hypothetical protein